MLIPLSSVFRLLNGVSGSNTVGMGQPDPFGTDPFIDTLEMVVSTDPTVNDGGSRGTGERFPRSWSCSPVSSVPVVGHSESSDTELTEETESQRMDSFTTRSFLFPVTRKLCAPREKTDPSSDMTCSMDFPAPSVESFGVRCKEADFPRVMGEMLFSLTERWGRLREPSFVWNPCHLD